MLDSFKRQINYMRISITDRCNLRCTYCMPEDGIEMKNHCDIISYETILDVVSEAVKLGITKIRLTGGEPLVRKNVEWLIHEIINIDGIEEIGLTTNGVLLAQKAESLWENGLRTINISLDTLDEKKYRELTRCGVLQPVLDGIDEAIRLGFKIKLNMVVMDNTTDDDIAVMNAFCDEKGIKLQLINHFSITQTKETSYCFDRPPDCSTCNRVRLLADGTLKPCLHSDSEFEIDMKDIQNSIKKAINAKPERGTECTKRGMSQIGG